MIQRKPIVRKPFKVKVKLCKECTSPAFSGGLCKYHDALANPDKYEISLSRKPKSGKSRGSRPKPTGELELFKQIYEQRGKRCEITDELLQFSVSCFAHILSKGAYPSLRLNPENIIMVKSEIHTLYDCRGKKELLESYPEASIIYEKKDVLRSAYYEKRAAY